MFTLNELAEYHRMQGLFVYTDGCTGASLGILRPPPISDTQNKEVTRFARLVQLRRWDLPTGPLYIEDETVVRPVGSGWTFYNESVVRFGGVNLDAVKWNANSLSDIVPIIENYYFKPPVQIDGWTFPLYQQPTWQLDRLIAAVKGARMMQADDVQRLIRENLNRIPHRRPGPTEYGRDTSYDYLLYYRTERTPDSALLYLRQDCGDAIICNYPTSAEIKVICAEGVAHNVPKEVVT